ncbi:carbohydrate ABC transporter permease [Halosimplex halophilum]|uniref:carbohydrate ABC transporter permease n=1 Tax=Halosimplex halophilum TaxID=2559572 RepID=UPI00107F9563|nr:sugar ABC transporter permease [Halosimplex halophilum]
MATEQAGPEVSDGILTRIATWTENLSEQAYAYLLLAPGFLVLLLFAFWPLASAVRMSFFADVITGGNLGEFVGFSNYVALLTNDNALAPAAFVDPSFQTPILEQALFMTVLFAVLSVAGETLLGFLYAMLMRAEYRGRRLVRLLIILPWAIPIVIQGMIFFLLFRPGYGLLTEPLQQIGLFSSLPLNTTFDGFVIVTVADIWKTSAFMALLILAGLESVNQDLYEVADVMGASRWQRFRHITFPLVFPVLMVAMLFRTMGALRVYGIIESTGVGCSTVPSMTCLVTQMMFGSATLYGSAAAVSVLIAIVVGLFITIYLGFIRRSNQNLGFA